MYLASEALRWLLKDNKLNLSSEEISTFKAYKGSLDGATRFIPFWVKMATAIALGLGTMIGWKRIVVTVGEKIGKAHLTYAQGASAELVAMAPFSLPTSMACRFRRPTCCLPAWQERWRRTAPACRCRPFEIS